MCRINVYEQMCLKCVCVCQRRRDTRMECVLLPPAPSCSLLMLTLPVPCSCFLFLFLAPAPWCSLILLVFFLSYIASLFMITDAVERLREGEVDFETILQWRLGLAIFGVTSVINGYYGYQEWQVNSVLNSSNVRNVVITDTRNGRQIPCLMNRHCRS